MFYGMKYYNDLLMEAGPQGNVQSELLLQKNKDTFTFKQGWAFPHKVYFNGDECMLPPPDTYPFLPNSATANPVTFFKMAASVLLVILAICWIYYYECRILRYTKLNKSEWIWKINGLPITAGTPSLTSFYELWHMVHVLSSKRRNLLSEMKELLYRLETCTWCWNIH